MANVTFHLPNFPKISQLDEDPGGKYPNVNTHMDCVPTSIAAALSWFTGEQYLGDEIIDAVYGPTYIGGTAAVRYTAYCAERGVKISPINGTPAQLVRHLHTLIHQNKPTLVTVPGHWNDPKTSGANPGNVTHVMVVCGDGPGVIEVMNPWTGAFEVYTDSWFQTKLCYGQIWPMEKTSMLKIVPHGWIPSADEKTLTAPNGVAISGPWLDWMQQQTWWYEGNLPLAAVHPVEEVDASMKYGKGQRLDFRFGPSLFMRPTDTTPHQVATGAELQMVSKDAASFQQQVSAQKQEIATLNAQIAALKASQGLGLSPAQAAAVNQITPLLVSLAAAAPSFTTAFATVPKPNVTAPLPAPSQLPN